MDGGAFGPNQASASIHYDSYGRPYHSVSPHGAATTYAYAYNPPTVTATTGTRVVKTTLDGLGRTIKVETGDTTSVKSVVETEYDSCACSPLGKVKRVSLPHAPGATVYWTTYTYDALGRTLTLTAADGSVTSYLYQGNCTTATDPAGKWKKYTSDAMGNLTQVTEPAPGGGTHQTYYTYNILNQLKQVSMPRGSVTQTRTFNYDLATGRLTSAVNPENGTVSYTYNGDGSLASKTDALNQQTSYSYDYYGRLTQAAGYTYYYDTNPFDPYYSWNAWGRLTAVAWTSSSMGLDFKEMYRYSAGGLMLGKRLRLTANPDPQNPIGHGELGPGGHLHLRLGGPLPGAAELSRLAPELHVLERHAGAAVGDHRQSAQRRRRPPAGGQGRGLRRRPANSSRCGSTGRGAAGRPSPRPT